LNCEITLILGKRGEKKKILLSSAQGRTKVCENISGIGIYFCAIAVYVDYGTLISY
jgi:hypothetical protein